MHAQWSWQDYSDLHRHSKWNKSDSKIYSAGRVLVYQLICETEPDASDVLPFNILTKKQTLLCELKNMPSNMLMFCDVLFCVS